MQIERDEARLFYTFMGSGPVVVLIHPTPVHHAFWMPMAEQLADRYRLLLLDLRGHGQSGLGTGPVTVEKLIRDVHVLLEAEGIARAAFVGCSLGGYLLYEYWKKYPNEMAAMALLCSKPQPDAEVNRERRHQWMRDARKPGGLVKFFDTMADTLIGPTCTQRHPKKRAAARVMMNTMSLEAMLAVQQGLMLRPDSVPTLETIRIPVCAIAGGEDTSSTPEEMRVIAEKVPAAEFHLIEDAGHYAPLEQPEKVAAILGHFLDTHYSDDHNDPEAKG
ncbi:MAG TPA: alpha/beta fold hydrolase [Acidobacteriaceae bacterium]|nr:alpha/beta fold hydrolase [Acidobacteriaceae bacterium]